MPAGKGGDIGTTLGQLLIPQTMAGMQDYRAKEREMAQKNNTQEMLSRLVGGVQSPSTGVVWDTPRPMDDTEQKSTLLQAMPELALGGIKEKFFPAAPEILKGAPGETFKGYYPKTGKVTDMFSISALPSTHKTGDLRDYVSGGEKITEEWDGTKWLPKSKGAAFAPAQEAPPVEIDDPTSPTGRRLVPRASAINQPGPPQQSPQAAANTLRDEFNKSTEAVRTVASQYRNAIKGAAADTGAGDMVLIYSLMKAVDPGSSVKEGEYAQGEQLTGAFGQLWQAYNKAKDGTKLLPEVRKDILAQMNNVYRSHLPQFESTKKRYTDIATRQRLNPADVISELPSVDGALDDGAPSQEDLEFTAKKYGMTVDQVKQKLGVK